MFNKAPQILAHKSAVSNSSLVLPNYIINKEYSLLHRYCPHRMFPLHNIGEQVQDVMCNFHGFKWDYKGIPLNNTNKLHCGSATVGKSGLLFKNFNEPEHWWVQDLANEQSLNYSHVKQGSSHGSWLWMMEIQSDLLHIRDGDGAIHPQLASSTNLTDIGMEEGNGWIIQTCSTGWWLFIYPYTFIEYSPGCLSINYTIPKQKDSEFGFDWVTQFYYDPKVSQAKRAEFETLEDVFLEDVNAIEKQKGKWFPLVKSSNRLEDHCVHWGNWVKEHKHVGT